jgi:N-acetylglucosaminyldiphosphoundecaprenol N-acetyl-beta-D-mannosaminyltransferase
VQSQKRQRILFLNVPIDNVAPHDLPSVIRTLMDSQQRENIVLLSVWDFLRARKTTVYRLFVQNAALVLPISASLVHGIRFLMGEKVYKHVPFETNIAILSTVEERDRSVYLFGGTRKLLQIVESNVRQTFPSLTVVGRHAAAYKKKDEAVLLHAIKKTAPTLLLVGEGTRGRELWLAKNTEKLGSGLHLWCSDLYTVFAKKRKRPSLFFSMHNMEWLWFTVTKPFYFLRIFLFISYKIVLLITKILKKGTKYDSGSS